jgi:energy-coupling factor transport system substrate-specific component
MFQSYGIHGPVLGPVSGLVIDVILLALAFWMLASPDMKKVSNVLTFVTLVTSVSLLRVLMTPLPNIQPVTVAALIIGAQLGARRGVAFAVLVTMISNFIIGDGIWTLYQAIGWSVVAIIGSSSKIIINGQLQLNKTFGYAIICAFLFDFIVSLSVLGTVSLSGFMVYLLNGIPYDILHAVGNLSIAAWFGIWFSEAITKFQSMEEIEQKVVDGYVTRT